MSRSKSLLDFVLTLTMGIVCFGVTYLGYYLYRNPESQVIGNIIILVGAILSFGFVVALVVGIVRELKRATSQRTFTILKNITTFIIMILLFGLMTVGTIDGILSCERRASSESEMSPE